MLTLFQDALVTQGIRRRAAGKQLFQCCKAQQRIERVPGISRPKFRDSLQYAIMDNRAYTSAAQQRRLKRLPCPRRAPPWPRHRRHQVAWHH